MSETVLLIADPAHAYGPVLAAQIARSLEREGARAVLLARENGAGAAAGVTVERISGGVALAAHRIAARHGARRVVVLGGVGPWVVLARAVRRIILLRTSQAEPDGPAHRWWRCWSARLAARRLFSGWLSLVPDPEERVFLRTRFTLFPPITSLTCDEAPPGAHVGDILVLQDQLEDRDEMVSALRAEVGSSRVTTVGARGDVPITPLPPLLARARLLVAPPVLEPVLEAAALGVPVLIPARSHDAQRRARYLERKLPATVVVDSLAAALARAPNRVEDPRARDTERETLSALARAVLE